MQLDDTERDELIRRLHRVGGQIGGIAKMLEESRECRDVATQFAAATQALRRAGYQFVSQTLAHCLADPDAAEQEGYSPAELERLFLRL